MHPSPGLTRLAHDFVLATCGRPLDARTLSLWILMLAERDGDDPVAILRGLYHRVARVDRRVDTAEHAWPSAEGPWCDVAERIRASLDRPQRAAVFLRTVARLSEDLIAAITGLDAEAQSRGWGDIRATSRAAARVSVDDALLRRALEPREADDAPGPGAIIAGRYLLHEVVGEGAQAVVYRAQDLRLALPPTALKLYRDEAEHDPLAQRRSEIAAMSSVWHPAVVPLRGYGVHEGKVYLEMPLLDGETLAQRIANAPMGLLPSEVAAIFEPLAWGLHALHEAGWVHGDVKPENVMLVSTSSPSGERPVLLDLGIAVRIGESLDAGTPRYLAPEVATSMLSWRAKRPATPAADVFALACAMLEALMPECFSGEAGCSVAELFARRAVSWTPPTLRPELRALDDAFARWLSPDPARRPQADELAREIGEALRGPRRPVSGVWMRHGGKGIGAA